MMLLLIWSIHFTNNTSLISFLLANIYLIPCFFKKKKKKKNLIPPVLCFLTHLKEKVNGTILVGVLLLGDTSYLLPTLNSNLSKRLFNVYKFISISLSLSLSPSKLIHQLFGTVTWATYIVIFVIRPIKHYCQP